MRQHRCPVIGLGISAALVAAAWAGVARLVAAAQTDSVNITASDCIAGSVGTSIPASAIGEPVSAVTLAAPRWIAATETATAYCAIDGALLPIDSAPTARPINFRVAMPASWTRRAAQLGGGGLNGVIPNLTGGGPSAPFARGFVTFGSDSGHQIAGPPDWTLNDEAIRNLGYMQMKKTRDAAMVLIERVYGARPRFTYYIGTSQGGREALTVAERYAADYDGIIANVPIVGFSSLMLAPELIRIQEKPLANWVTPEKVNAIRSEFIRQCDRLDGLVDGIINNYMACRTRFGETAVGPWAAKRCPNGIDSNPSDTSASACLTDGQIGTLRFVYGRYTYSTPLANDDRAFGMWVPNTDPSGSGLILSSRFRGQQGAPADGPLHTHLGVLGVTGFLMRNPGQANPLDYVEGQLNERRQELSAWLDATSADFTAFHQRGGRMILTIGTNDTLASPGEQLDYYQSVVERMGRQTVDAFARLYVLPQTSHGLSGTSYTVDGNGRTISPVPIPNTFDRLSMLIDWVERNIAPGRSVVASAGTRTLPVCSYPEYPQYVSGPTDIATSYRCAD
jgi:feruloyl esterase